MTEHARQAAANLLASSLSKQPSDPREDNDLVAEVEFDSEGEPEDAAGNEQADGPGGYDPSVLISTES